MRNTSIITTDKTIQTNINLPKKVPAKNTAKKHMSVIH